MGIFRAIQRLISRITGNQKLRVQRAKATISLMSEQEFEDLVSWLLGLQEKHIYEHEKQLLDTINQSNRATEILKQIRNVHLQGKQNLQKLQDLKQRTKNKMKLEKEELEFEEFLGSLYGKLLNTSKNPNMNEEHSLIFLEFIKVESNEEIIESIALSLNIEERKKWLRMADTDLGRLQIFQKVGMEISQ
jgi:hypothetical protein